MPASKVGEGEFAQWLYRTRRKLGFNQDSLALVLDKSQAEVSRWETGKDLPDAADVIRVAQVLDSDPFEVHSFVLADTMSEEGGASTSHSTWNVQPLRGLREHGPPRPGKGRRRQATVREDAAA